MFHCYFPTDNERKGVYYVFVLPVAENISIQLWTALSYVPDDSQSSAWSFLLASLTPPADSAARRFFSLNLAYKYRNTHQQDYSLNLSRYVLFKLKKCKSYETT